MHQRTLQKGTLFADCLLRASSTKLEKQLQNSNKGGEIMPYILGWFLGVPLIVLVLLYLVFH
ncbi:hypothetical protein [Paraburkholderia saeva]|uniref:Uncharacterized protein n=1 Tax=Paraburkholderia saeva TaxID=2777537 RepID=A0A9N8X361_9BURK|nr:hypothetical protein [Paraburkholderia saeva]CAG4889158.1 hypothetical protein R52603_00886 [Paraburkholderia saeva]CAG4894376.1 hypothetical protein R70241_01774 [Paraburkholderia saeva]CAG4917361.1 hypothetical protein LMG31841_04673 [Paraburkholderia saeva]